MGNNIRIMHKLQLKSYTTSIVLHCCSAQLVIMIIIIIYSFVCYFSKLEYIAHHKAKNKTQSKQTSASMHTRTHARAHARKF